MVDFPSRLVARIEMAFGADRTADPLTWSWTDVTEYFQGPNPAITVGLRGRQNEMDEVQPSSCDFVLDNKTGAFTPGLVTSPFYPNVVVGTPCRVFIDLPDELAPEDVVDTFARTVAVTADPALSSWGTSESHHRWTPTDDVDGTEFSVSGGVGVVDAAGWNIKHQVLDVAYRDFDASFTVSPQQGSSGVAPYAASLFYRGDMPGLANPCLAEVWFYPTGVLWVSLEAGGLAQTANTGLPFAALDVFEVRVQVRDNIQRIKVWEQGSPEPASWSLEFTSASTYVYGSVGLGINVYAGASTPNVLHFDDVRIAPKDPVFYGDISSISPAWPYGDLSVSAAEVSDGDPDAVDAGESFAAFEVSGVLRRLGQGGQALESSVKRGMVRRSPLPVAYWPMEDGERAASFAAGLVGPQHKPMSKLGTINPAQEAGFVASAPLPTFGANARATGAVPVYTPTGDVRVMWWMKTPSGGWPNASYLLRLTGTGSIATWTLRVSNIGELRLRGFDGDGVEVFTGSLVNYGLNDRYVAIWVWLSQIGSSIDAQVGTFDQVTGVTGVFNEVVSNRTFGRITTVTVGDPNFNMGDGAFGHVAVLNDPFFWAMTDFMLAHRGEYALTRLQRLLSEESIPFKFRGVEEDTPQMGYQGVKPLLELLQECADADGGVLYEPKGEGLAYRTRRNMYNQTRVLALDAGGLPGDIVNPFQPQFDDANLVNRATMSSSNGTSYTVEDSTSIARSGLYDSSETINVLNEPDLQDAAEQLVFFGTWPGMRYPSVSPALNGVPELLKQWQVRDIGDAVSVSNLPPQHPTGPVALIMQGYKETILPYRWDPEMNCTPGGPWQVGQIPGTPSEGTPTRLGTQLSTLDASISDGDTSLSVATADGFLWVTTATQPDEFPLDIRIGTEVLQVTAISGTSSPQTFTVLRGAEAQAHTAGDLVLIDPQARVAR